MSFKTLSAIRKHEWLIHDEFVLQNMSLIMQMLKGEKVDFGEPRVEIKEPVLIVASGAPGTGLMAAVYNVSPGTGLGSIPAGSIVQMDIIGPVLKYGDMCSYGSADQAAQINRMAANGNIAGIILNIDSPGGQAAGTSMLADAIKSATQQKPVVAVIDDGMAASAAMWIASACTEIYTTKKTDQVGSIGVFTSLADWYSYYAEQGLNVRDIYAPQSTDKNSDYRQALAGNDDQMKKSLGNLADAFINAIQTNRGSKLTSDEWNTGKMFDAKKATKIGLIDGIKSYQQVTKRVEQLISNRNNQNTYNMTAFAKIMAAAGITQIAVIDGGFLVTEETLNALENKLSENENLDAAHAATVENLNGQIAEKDAKIVELTAVDNAAIIADLNGQIAAKDATILELKAQVSVKPAQAFTSAKKQANGDHLEGADANKYQTSFDVEKQALREKAGLTTSTKPKQS